MHAHLPKTTMNGHWRKLKTDVSLSLGSVMWSLFSYQNVLFSDEKDFLSLPALRGNEAWIKILHNFTTSCYHKAVGCSPFSCTVVVDLYFYFFCVVLNDNGVDVGGFLSLFLCCCWLLLIVFIFWGLFGWIIVCQTAGICDVGYMHILQSKSNGYVSAVCTKVSYLWVNRYPHVFITSYIVRLWWAGH